MTAFPQIIGSRVWVLLARFFLLYFWQAKTFLKRGQKLIRWFVWNSFMPVNPAKEIQSWLLYIIFCPFLPDFLGKKICKGKQVHYLSIFFHSYQKHFIPATPFQSSPFLSFCTVSKLLELHTKSLGERIPALHNLRDGLITLLLHSECLKFLDTSRLMLEPPNHGA